MKQHQKFKKFKCIKNNNQYVIQEDLAGWYLIVYRSKHTEVSSKDFLLDSLEDAMLEAEEEFGISLNNWQPVI